MTDDRRQTKPKGIVDVVELRSPGRPVSREEFDDLRGQVVTLRSKMSDWQSDMIAGVNRHITTSIGSMRDDVAKLLELSQAAGEWRSTIARVTVLETNAKAEELADKKVETRDAQVQRGLGHHQQAVDVATKEVVAIDSRIDGRKRRRLAWLAALAAPTVSLIIAGIAAAASHCK